MQGRLPLQPLFRIGGRESAGVPPGVRGRSPCIGGGWGARLAEDGQAGAAGPGVTGCRDSECRGRLRRRRWDGVGSRTGVGSCGGCGARRVCGRGAGEVSPATPLRTPRARPRVPARCVTRSMQRTRCHDPPEGRVVLRRSGSGAHHAPRCGGWWHREGPSDLNRGTRHDQIMAGRPPRFFVLAGVRGRSPCIGGGWERHWRASRQWHPAFAGEGLGHRRSPVRGADWLTGVGRGLRRGCGGGAPASAKGGRGTGGRAASGTRREVSG